MILIALGANLPSRYGSPESTLRLAQREMERRGVRILRASRIWITPPDPPSDQPWYRNAAVSVETALEPGALFSVLKDIERDFGRIDASRNAARIIDLDLLTYKRKIFNAPSPQRGEGWGEGGGDHDINITLPHPRLHQRSFVLLPLREITPDWTHPVLKKSVTEMVSALPEDRDSRPLEPEAK